MSKSKGPEMNEVWTIGEGSCGINNQPQTQTICLSGVVKGGANKIKGFTCQRQRDRKSKHVFDQRGESGRKWKWQVWAREAAGTWAHVWPIGGGVRMPESVAPPRRAQMEHVWLKYMHANGWSCHKGANIAKKQQLIAFVQKSKSTPWGTDHAK